MTGPPRDAEANEYVLGTDAAELQRLGFQHRVWSAPAFALWERAGVAQGKAVLDVGCGPGYAALDLARLVGPQGQVLAVDVSERFVAHLQAEAARLGLGQVETRVADVATMDVPAAHFDVAWCRWVLCFVPDPEAVVARVARALKPGGTFCIQDYYLYRAATLAPSSAAFTRVIEATNRSWLETGGDPDIGMRLPSLLEKHGLRVREVSPLVRVGRPGSMVWDWPPAFFRLFIPRLIAKGYLTGQDETEFWRDFTARSREPGAFFVSPPMLDVIGVRT